MRDVDSKLVLIYNFVNVHLNYELAFENCIIDDD